MKKPLSIASLAFFFTLLMSGCTQSNPTKVNESLDVERYEKTNLIKAQTGTIKWSAYYSGLIDAVGSIPPTQRGRDKKITDLFDQLKNAENYENGRISLEKFKELNKN